ncbi:hypothetical protein BCR43DRAFT_293110 [Syncephalastrum racemosum]|uniref:Uncharacterized protein n=1 Tax=Syncephalastrum racemosum TaxID=13706 RepID=A0A1X2HDN1_SYNRA|nr:hypothetical protein BCR43DRAFT_293110 [Syncephalastrum racemosum]
MPSMYLLKQVRSKFDQLSTYTMCRSSSAIASQLEFQPLSIWTLSDQESNQSSISQEKLGSLLFRELATQVIRDGDTATLGGEALMKLTNKAKKSSALDAVFGKIRQLFKDRDHVGIIGNKLLNSQLTDLADIISCKRDNDKKIELLSKALYD